MHEAARLLPPTIGSFTWARKANHTGCQSRASGAPE